MSRRGRRAKKRGMVVRYGDEHDCGVWVRCNAEVGEDYEREMEEYENRILRMAECIGGYRECDEIVRESI
jgi:hypothetical protein